MAEARTLTDRLPVHGRGQVGTPWWGMLCLFATEGRLKPNSWIGRLAFGLADV